jgi:hypothetical protein
MIRKTVYATAVVAFGLIVGGSAYAASAGEDATATPRPVVTAPSADDDGGRLDRDQRVEPGDDRRTQGTRTPDDSRTHGTRTAEPGDDNGGRLDRDQRVEPGDDRRPRGADDRGRGRGRDDKGRDDKGRDDKGRDDRGGDDD